MPSISYWNMLSLLQMLLLKRLFALSCCQTYVGLEFDMRRKFECVWFENVPYSYSNCLPAAVMLIYKKNSSKFGWTKVFLVKSNAHTHTHTNQILVLDIFDKQTVVLALFLSIHCSVCAAGLPPKIVYTHFNLRQTTTANACACARFAYHSYIIRINTPQIE